MKKRNCHTGDFLIKKVERMSLSTTYTNLLLTAFSSHDKRTLNISSILINRLFLQASSTFVPSAALPALYRLSSRAVCGRFQRRNNPTWLQSQWPPISRVFVVQRWRQIVGFSWQVPGEQHIGQARGSRNRNPPHITGSKRDVDDDNNSSDICPKGINFWAISAPMRL